MNAFVTEFEAHEDFYLALRTQRISGIDLNNGLYGLESKEYGDASLSGNLDQGGMCIILYMNEEEEEEEDGGNSNYEYLRVTPGEGVNCSLPRTKPFLNLSHNHLFTGEWVVAIREEQ